MKSKEQIKQLSHLIAEYEKEFQSSYDINKIEEMIKILSDLSFEDVEQLDEYILNHHLL